MSAFRTLQQQHGWSAGEIERVVVRSCPMALSARFRTVNPENSVSSQFSNAHCFAMLAYGVEPGPKWHQPEMILAPHVAAFREKVSTEPEPTAEEMGSGWITASGAACPRA